MEPSPRKKMRISQFQAPQKPRPLSQSFPAPCPLQVVTLVTSVSTSWCYLLLNFLLMDLHSIHILLWMGSVQYYVHETHSHCCIWLWFIRLHRCIEVLCVTFYNLCVHCAAGRPQGCFPCGAIANDASVTSVGPWLRVLCVQTCSYWLCRQTFVCID